MIDRLEMDSVYVLRVRGCNKAGYGEYSEEVYLHTPPAPGTQTESPLLSRETRRTRSWTKSVFDVHISDTYLLVYNVDL